MTRPIRWCRRHGPRRPNPILDNDGAYGVETRTRLRTHRQNLARRRRPSPDVGLSHAPAFPPIGRMYASRELHVAIVIPGIPQRSLKRFGRPPPIQVVAKALFPSISAIGCRRQVQVFRWL